MNCKYTIRHSSPESVEFFVFCISDRAQALNETDLRHIVWTRRASWKKDGQKQKELKGKKRKSEIERKKKRI